MLMKWVTASFLSFLACAKAFAAGNPFATFVGSYQVTSASCTYNGAPNRGNCNPLQIIVQVRDGDQAALEIKEVLLGHEFVYQLDERKYSDQYRTDFATLESSAPNSAQWVHHQSTSDGRTTFEVREMKQINENNYTYSFYRQDKTSFGEKEDFMQRYALQWLK